MLKNLIIVTLLAFSLGCDAGEEVVEQDNQNLALGGKADQACDLNAGDAHSVEADAGLDDGDAMMVMEGDASEESDVIEAGDGTEESSDTVLADGEVLEEEWIEEEPEELVEEETLCVDAEDPFAEAYDVNLHRITFPEGTPAPTYAAANTSQTPFRLGGTEFWQKWSGGLNPTYSYYAGTSFGQRCMYASARRFEAIMAVAPESLASLRENSGWSGSFFNWNDDYSESTWGDGNKARLWAWRTTLIKWISQTNLDGSCFLPTLSMVEALAENCANRAENSDGQIQGCTN